MVTVDRRGVELGARTIRTLDASFRRYAVLSVLHITAAVGISNKGSAPRAADAARCARSS